MKRNNQYHSPRGIALYNAEGKLVLTPQYIKEVCDYLNVNESTLWRAIKGRDKIADHPFIMYDKATEKPPKTIEIDKRPTRFKDPQDGRLKRMYLFYDVNGTLTHEKPMFLNEAMEYLGVHKDTILDGIIKNHLCNKHIVRMARSKTIFPKKLAPLAKEFNLFQYDKEGNLINWFTTMSVASRRLGIPYDTIRNCTVKGVSTHEKYFFTNRIPMSNYKITKVKFAPKYTPFIIHVSHDGKKETMSVSKACQYIGTSYVTLKKKLTESSRFIYKGFLIEKA